MLLRLIKYFRGYVEVALWGYAPERFLNLCSNHDILIWDLCQKGDAYVFKISVDGFRCLKPLLKKSGTHIRISHKNGIPFFFFRYRKRKMLFLSIFACMVILYVLSRFIWKININGNDMDELEAAFQEAKETKGMPTAIIAHTLKGKGVSFMEGVPIWHYRMPNETELPILMRDLNLTQEELES